MTNGPDPTCGPDARAPDPPNVGDTGSSRVERLERRLEREVRARRQAELIAEDGMRALWSANRELEDRVAERTAELERSLAAANTADAAKERFLDELGHDLATPLHNVLGLIELIDTETMSAVDRRRMGEVADQSTRLADLLRALVDLAGAEGAPPPAEATTTTASVWLDEVVASWTRPAARRAQLLVPAIASDSDDLRAGWRRLRRAVDLVLSNVVTHADPGPVTLTVDADESRIRVTVTDSGPGMPPELAATAHVAFVAAGEHGGVGIGLSLAVRLLESAGGTLDVDASEGRTTVVLTVPAG